LRGGVLSSLWFALEVVETRNQVRFVVAAWSSDVADALLGIFRSANFAQDRRVCCSLRRCGGCVRRRGVSSVTASKYRIELMIGMRALCYRQSKLVFCLT